MTATIIPMPVPSDSRLDYALLYAKIGWHVFPCHWIVDGACACGTACKTPGKHPISQIAPRGYENATTDEVTIRSWWTQCPDANIGVSLVASKLVAVDIDPRNGGWDTIDMLEAVHGPLTSDVLALTGGGGEHRVFSLSDSLGLPGMLGPGVDLKRNGYIIVEPSTHISGKCYGWELSSNPLEGIVPSPLPDWIRGSYLREALPALPEGPVKPLPDNELRELQAALPYITALERQVWLDVGMALHSTQAGSQAFELWDSWSRSCPEKYDAVDQMRVWRSFRNKGIVGLTRATIFKYAQDSGWVNVGKKKPAATTADDAELVELSARANHPPKMEIVDRQREVVPFPGASLNALCDWLCDATGAQMGIAVQTAAIAIAALSSSRLYTSPMGDGTHLHQMLSAASYSEVGPLINAVNQVFHDAGLRKMVREQRLGSASGLFKTLYRSPATLYLSAEWGRKFFGPQFASVEHVGILIGQGYAKPMWVLDAPEEAGLKKSEMTDDAPIIRTPSLNLLAYCADTDLANTFSESQAGRGFVETLLFARVSIAYERDPLAMQAPQWLADHVRKVRRLPQSATELDLASIFNGNAGLLPTLTEIGFQVSPGQYYEQLDVPTEHRGQRSVVAVARMTMRRLACAIAVWENPERPAVTHQVWQWCAQFVRGSLIEVFDAMALGGSDDSKAGVYEKVLAAITRAGADGLTPGYLPMACKPYRSLDRERRDKLIEQMLLDEVITSHPERPKALVAAGFVRECKV